MVRLTVSRRDFLRQLGVGIIGVTMFPLVEGCDSNLIEPIAQPAAFAFLTLGREFFVQNGAQASTPNWQMPNLDVASWKVQVDGLVGNPKSYSLADLKALAAGREITLLKTLQCVFDAPLLASVTGLASNGSWTGIPLRLILEDCGVDLGRSVRIRFHGSEGFGNNVKIGRIFGPQEPGLLPACVVWDLNGAPLPREHGAPARLILPESYGYKNVKWLTRIEATGSDAPFGTYQDHGFFDEGTLSVNSRTTAPLNASGISPGPHEVVGFAVAGAGPVTAVEVRVDAGPWMAAEVVPLEEIARLEGFDPGALEQIRRGQGYPFRGVWAPWRYIWDAAPGIHTLEVRARDGAGNVQPEVDGDVRDGTNAITKITLSVG